MGDSDDPQLRRRFRTLPRLNRQLLSDFGHATSPPKIGGCLNRSNLPIFFGYIKLNHPNCCWWNHLKSSLKSGWVLLTVAAALPGRPNACGCCPLGENSEGRDSIPMRDLMRLEMTWKGSKHIYKKIKTYENVVFQVRILVTCYILSDSLIHWTLSNSKEVYIKHEVTGVWNHWSACAGSSSWGDPAWEALYQKKSMINQNRTIKNNINDLWTYMNHVWKGEFIPALRELRVS